MNNHTKTLKQSILVLSGVVGGLAAATTLISFNGGGTDSAEASSAALADQSQGQQDTAAAEQPPTTVVVYVNEDGAVIAGPESTGSVASTSESEDVPVDDSDPVVPVDDSDPVDPGDGDAGDVVVYTELPTTDEDLGPLVLVEVPIWIDDTTPLEPIDFCELFPWLCSGDGPLVEELPEPCDPDDGTCPGWVIEEIIEMMPEPCGPGGCPAWVVEDLIQTIDSFDFEYSPIGIVHPDYFIQPPAIGGWTPIGF